MTRGHAACYGLGMTLTLDEIGARLEIDHQLARYCRAIDTGEWDLLDSIFTADAVIDYTSSGGIRGAFSEVKSWLAKILPLFAMRQHYVTNREVTIDGDRATSIAYLYNPMGRRRDDGGLDLFFVGGTYRDRWVRTAQGWRIVERVETEWWRDGRPR
jgi:SnoaL-like protein